MGKTASDACCACGGTHLHSNIVMLSQAVTSAQHGYHACVRMGNICACMARGKPGAGQRGSPCFYACRACGGARSVSVGGQVCHFFSLSMSAHTAASVMSAPHAALARDGKQAAGHKHRMRQVRAGARRTTHSLHRMYSA
jgi:hypothetical protein